MTVDSPTSHVIDEDLLRRLWPGLVRLGRLLTGSQQLGEDIAQEAIVALLQQEAVRSPPAYLRRCMVNLSINESRKKTRERAHLATLREEQQSPPDMDEIWPIVVKLPSRQRAVLVLRYYEDLSEADIAAILGCRPGTVKSLAARALKRLREEVRP